MSTIDRILELVDESGLTAKEYAINAGLGAGNITDWKTGRSKPSVESLQKIAKYANVQLEWLTGDSEYKTLHDVYHSIFNNAYKKEISDIEFYKCPVYGQIAAGLPNWAEECLEGYLPIDPNLMNIVNPEECFFLRVDGESMNKVIRNGAYALIRKQDIVENGEIAAVLVNGDNATIKKFNQRGEVIVLEPMSDDSDFQIQIYDKNTNIKILGKYIGKFEMNI